MFDFFFGSPVSRILVTVGIVLIVAGLLWPVLQRLGLGRLPGDVVIERDNVRVYIPIVTSLVLSVLLTLVLWLINR